jgi:hypothetical protein
VGKRVQVLDPNQRKKLKKKRDRKLGDGEEW